MSIQSPAFRLPVALAYISVILIWSTTPLAISWGANEVGFLYSLSSRMILGCLIALAVIFIFKISFSLKKRALMAYLVSGLGIYFAMTATYAGALYIPSGWLSVIYSFSPVLTGIFAHYLLAEKLTWNRLLGLFIAIIGLVCIFWQSLEQGENSTIGLVLLIIGVVSQSLSAVAIKWLDAKQHGLVMTAMGLTVAAPLFFFSWLIFDGQFPTNISNRAIMTIIYLAIMGSVIGFSLYYYLIDALPASTVSLITLITPVLSLLMGYSFNHEKITFLMMLGTGLILLGLVTFQLQIKSS